MISSKIGSKALFWQRTFSTTRSQLSKVVVLGAAGGIGQPLSLLLKQNPLVSHLSLYDIVNAEGVATDISHINTASKVTGHGPANDGLSEALNGAKVVVVPAGVPRKPGMTRDDLFNTNAGIVRDLAEACARTCPTAHILIISNPVNSTVPIVSEVFKKHGVYDPKRIFGVTTLDVVRASKFVSEVTNISSDCSPVVIGGHSGITIIPLFSQLAGFNLSGEALDKLINRVQFGGDEVVKAKNGTGSATLSMAFAGARFANSVLRATVAGERGICEPSYVRSPVMEAEGVHYFSTKIELGPNGVEKIHPIGKVSAHEETLIKASIPELQKNIEKGVAFANKMGAY